jgi:hypothetical protein
MMEDDHDDIEDIEAVEFCFWCPSCLEPAELCWCGMGTGPEEE